MVRIWDRIAAAIVITEALMDEAVRAYIAANDGRIRPEAIIGLMIGLLMMAYTLPTAITTLANTNVSADPATAALWGLLPLLAVVAVIGWLMKVK